MRGRDRDQVQGRCTGLQGARGSRPAFDSLGGDRHCFSISESDRQQYQNAAVNANDATRYVRRYIVYYDVQYVHVVVLLSKRVAFSCNAG